MTDFCHRSKTDNQSIALLLERVSWELILNEFIISVTRGMPCLYFHSFVQKCVCIQFYKSLYLVLGIPTCFLISERQKIFHALFSLLVSNSILSVHPRELTSRHCCWISELKCFLIITRNKNSKTWLTGIERKW